MFDILMKFSNKEKKELFYAGLMISLAFAILMSGGLSGILSIQTGFFVVFVIAFFTAGVAFLLHEMMHKFIAQRYGLWAEFRAYYQGLWMALLFSLMGFIVAAPGAVYIGGQVGREKNGKISLAGPLTNIILALIFLIPMILLQTAGAFAMFIRYGFTINSLLAAFNLIPILPFDGAKILDWNKGIYFVSVIIAVGLFFGSFIL